MDEQNNVSTPETNYIDVINNMKQNTVSKDEYNRVLADNRKLAESLAVSAVPSTEDEAITIPTEDEVKGMRESLFKINKSMSNLDYTRKMLDLRDALIARGEKDPFLPTTSNSAVTEADEARAQAVADGLRQIVNYCGNDAQLFNSELKRCCR